MGQLNTMRKLRPVAGLCLQLGEPDALSLLMGVSLQALID